MACVFGEMRTLKTGSRAAVGSPNAVPFGEKNDGARWCETIPRMMRFVQNYARCSTERAAQDTSTRIWHLGFISRCTAYSVRWIAFRCCVSVRWIAFRCCVSVRWIACSFAAVELCRGTLTAHT